MLLLLGGIVVGPSVFDLADPSQLSLFATLGLGFLFLLAGYEIEPRILGSRVGRRAVWSWAASLLLAVAAVSLLTLVHWVRAPAPIAIGLSTTALGTLLPIMRDKGLRSGPLVESVPANGAVGEMFPVFAIAIVLGAYNSWLRSPRSWPCAPWAGRSSRSAGAHVAPGSSGSSRQPRPARRRQPCAGLSSCSSGCWC